MAPHLKFCPPSRGHGRHVSCHDDYFRAKRAGANAFGADRAFSDAGFCAHCGAFVPTRNEAAANIIGVPVWVHRTPGRIPSMIVRVSVSPTAEVTAHLHTGDAVRMSDTSARVINRRPYYLPEVG